MPPDYIAFEPKDVEVPKAYFRTQMEIIKSRWIIGRAVANLKIEEMPEIKRQPDPIEWLRKQLTVVAADDSDVFEIKYSSSSGTKAAQVVNEITEQYLTALYEEDVKRTRRIVDALTTEMNSREKAVRTLRSEVQDAAQGIRQ